MNVRQWFLQENCSRQAVFFFVQATFFVTYYRPPYFSCVWCYSMYKQKTKKCEHEIVCAQLFYCIIILGTSNCFSPIHIYWLSTFMFILLHYLANILTFFLIKEWHWIEKVTACTGKMAVNLFVNMQKEVSRCWLR